MGVGRGGGRGGPWPPLDFYTLFRKPPKLQKFFHFWRLKLSLFLLAPVLKNFLLTHLISIRGIILVIIVITVYSPSCLSQEIEKKTFGFRVKLPPVYHTP